MPAAQTNTINRVVFSCVNVRNVLVSHSSVGLLLQPNSPWLSQPPSACPLHLSPLAAPHLLNGVAARLDKKVIRVTQDNLAAALLHLASQEDGGGRSRERTSK